MDLNLKLEHDSKYEWCVISRHLECVRQVEKNTNHDSRHPKQDGGRPAE